MTNNINEDRKALGQALLVATVNSLITEYDRVYEDYNKHWGEGLEYNSHKGEYELELEDYPDTAWLPEYEEIHGEGFQIDWRRDMGGYVGCYLRFGTLYIDSDLYVKHRNDAIKDCCDTLYPELCNNNGNQIGYELARMGQDATAIADESFLMVMENMFEILYNGDWPIPSRKWNS